MGVCPNELKFDLKKKKNPAHPTMVHKLTLPIEQLFNLY